MFVAPACSDRCAWYLRTFFWRQRRKFGAPLQAALIWARSPRLFLAVAALYRLLDGSLSPLAPELRALLMVRVSQLNGCRFCVDLNSVTVLQRGISEAKLLAVHTWRSERHFSATEKTALDYAEAMTRQPDGIDASTREALRDHFDENEIIELTALIAFQNLSSRFNSALGVPPQGFCALAVPATAEEQGDVP